MMKLNFSLLDQDLELEQTTIFTITDVQVFSNIVQMIFYYEEEGELKLYYQNYQNLKETELLVITDILAFEVNSHQIKKLIYSDLAQQLNEKIEIKANLDDLLLKIIGIIEEEIVEHDLDLILEEITIDELFKALKLRVATEKESIYIKLMNIIEIYKYLNKKKLLILVNVCSYLTKNELEELLNYISLSQVNVLFLEPRIVYNFPQFVLDDDYILMPINVEK